MTTAESGGDETVLNYKTDKNLWKFNINIDSLT